VLSLTRVALAEMLFALAVAACRTFVNARVAFVVAGHAWVAARVVVVVPARVSSLRVAASPPRFSFARACHAGRL
jgi:hypothetical protein